MNHFFKKDWLSENNLIIASDKRESKKYKSRSTKKRLIAISIGLLSCTTAIASNNTESNTLQSTNGINITNNQIIEKIGNGQSAIVGIIDSINTVGNIMIENTGNLKTIGDHSYGIFAENNDIGNIAIEHSGNISTDGLASHGIYAKSSAHGASPTMNLFINDAKITINDSLAKNVNEIAYHIYTEQDNTLSGDVVINVNNSYLEGIHSDYGSAAVYVKSQSEAGNLLATINNTHISLDGYGADGIHLVNLNNNSHGNIEINVNGGSITTQDSDGNVEYNYAIFGNQKGNNAKGNILITNSQTNIVTGRVDNDFGRGGIGIHALFDGYTSEGNIVINNTGNITTLAKGDMNNGIYANNAGLGAISVTNTGNIVTNGTASSVIHVQQDGTSTSPRTSYIKNGGKLESFGNYSSGITLIKKGYGQTSVRNEGDLAIRGNFSHGIYLDVAGGNIYVDSSQGSILTSGETSHGIFVNNTSSSQDILSVTNSSDITTIGARTGSNNSSAAIRVSQRGDGSINLTNTGNILTKGIEARNIYVNAAGKADISLLNTGKLVAENSTAIGVYSQGNISLENRGDILAKNIANINGEVSAHGIEGVSTNGDVTIQHLAGDIIVENNSQSLKSHGITAWGDGSPNSLRSAHVIVGNGANIDATYADSGIFLATVKDGLVNIAQNSSIKGGDGAGIQFNIDNNGDSIYTIQNAGFIESKNDRAINVDGSNAISELNLGNSGTLQGYVSTNNKTALNLQNTGEFLVRNHDNQVKKVSISQFNHGVIDNSGMIQLMDSNLVNSDTSGEYTPNGAMSSINKGIQHGQFLGVKEFKHSGVLDLVGSGISGNVMVISGSNTAGTNGNGIFVTNGGTLKLATTLNKGDIDSRSDMLVVDNIKKGNAATKIDIIIGSNSQDEKTIADGIQVVQTLGAQEKGVFELLHPVTYGRYEYLLFDDNAAGVENGYYLRNKLKDPPGPIIAPPNPVIGVYLGNQYAAANMFNQNILDRRDNVRAPDQTVWGRVQYNELKTNHINNTQKLKIENTLIQLGIDLYQDHEKGQIAGVYAGYGKSDVTNISRLTGTKAEGSVDGFQLGAYYSWMPQENQGPYVDVWGHYATYRNKLHGKTQRGLEKKYDGYGFAVSAEAGYGFVIDESSYTKWVLEPHAQVTYNHINMDDFTDHNNTRFSNNKGKGFDIRLGARFYGYHPDDNGVLPFVELNWLHNGMDNAVYVNGHKEDSRIGRNVGELKLGLKGNLSKESSVFAHVGLEKGSNKYQRTKFQIGFNYNW